MQRNKTWRLAGVSLSAAALGLLTAEGSAAAHEGTSSSDLRGRVTPVELAAFVLKKFDGTAQTVYTSSTTTYSEPGSSVFPAGVVEGENVAVALDPTASGPDSNERDRVSREVGGRVANVSGSTLTVTNWHGGTETVLVTPDTKYLEEGRTPTGGSARAR